MYHMIEYIRDEPDALRRTFADTGEAVDVLVDGVAAGRWDRILVLGIGSSYTAALMALPALKLHCPIPVEVIPSTELGTYGAWLGPRTLVLSVSRSGEREWVVNPQRRARAAGSFTVAMTGVADSLLAAEADLVLVTREGPEITFSKTKSVAVCAALLMRLALRLAGDDDAARRRLAELDALPKIIQETIRRGEPLIRDLVPALDAIAHVYLCGAGTNIGSAYEGAIKIQETSYLPTKAEDTGNCLHGVLGTTDGTWLLVAIVTAADLDASREVLQLAGEAGAVRLAFAEPGLLAATEAEHVVEASGRVDRLLTSIVLLPLLQLLTYYLTVARGMNADAPAYMDKALRFMLPPGREEPELRGLGVA